MFGIVSEGGCIVSVRVEWRGGYRRRGAGPGSRAARRRADRLVRIIVWLFLIVTFSKIIEYPWWVSHRPRHLTVSRFTSVVSRQTILCELFRG